MSASNYVGTRQPDILEVIANLSNNEVFTPPRVANAVLDLLPEHVWTDPNLRWLDPASKTGVFPREITRRLMLGLADAIPDESDRLGHILTEMVHAIAITELTAMMTRRSLYCSKDAASEFAAHQFESNDGNVWYRRTEHEFDNGGRCLACGGRREQLEIPGRSNYAYALVHAQGRKAVDEEMGMKFDVVVGNPPYQLDIGDTSEVPIYDEFVRQAIALNPRYIAMIIPSRWMAGGKGLGEFRAEMLADRRFCKLVDYASSSQVFPAVSIRGGVCYFLWDQEHQGECQVEFVRNESDRRTDMRNLGEFDVYVRDARALSILQKVIKLNEPSVDQLVSGQNPFGLNTNFSGFHTKKLASSLPLYYVSGGKRSSAFVREKDVPKGHSLINKWKVLVPMAGSDGGERLPDVVLGQPFVAEKPSVCTQTYLAIGPFASRTEAAHFEEYLRGRLFRFLVSLRKITQHGMRHVYRWVPQQDWKEAWPDQRLYKKYGITKEEQAYIESMVKEMPA